MAQGSGGGGLAAQAPPDGAKSTLRESFESLVIAVILAFFVRTFVFQAFKIPTGSMENNLLIGDHLIVNKFIFGAGAAGIEQALLPMSSIKRGDILVFKYPVDPTRDFIKRVIGLPGDQIRIAERVIGHSVGGKLGETYDLYSYRDEKLQVLKAWETYVSDLLAGKKEQKVVPLRAGAGS